MIVIIKVVIFTNKIFYIEQKFLDLKKLPKLTQNPILSAGNKVYCTPSINTVIFKMLSHVRRPCVIMNRNNILAPISNSLFLGRFKRSSFVSRTQSIIVLLYIFQELTEILCFDFGGSFDFQKWRGGVSLKAASKIRIIPYRDEFHDGPVCACVVEKSTNSAIKF